MTKIRYIVSAPTSPGDSATEHGRFETLRDARRGADAFANRDDLTYQDVRIERLNGSLVEYAGPSR